MNFILARFLSVLIHTKDASVMDIHYTTAILLSPHRADVNAMTAAGLLTECCDSLSFIEFLARLRTSWSFIVLYSLSRSFIKRPVYIVAATPSRPSMASSS